MLCVVWVLSLLYFITAARAAYKMAAIFSTSIAPFGHAFTTTCFLLAKEGCAGLKRTTGFKFVFHVQTTVFGFFSDFHHQQLFFLRLHHVSVHQDSFHLCEGNCPVERGCGELPRKNPGSGFQLHTPSLASYAAQLTFCSLFAFQLKAPNKFHPESGSRLHGAPQRKIFNFQFFSREELFGNS
jgi:hypothetical protein